MNVVSKCLCVGWGCGCGSVCMYLGPPYTCPLGLSADCRMVAQTTEELKAISPDRWANFSEH